MGQSVCYSRTLLSFAGKASIWSCTQISLTASRRLDLVLAISSSGLWQGQIAKISMHLHSRLPGRLDLRAHSLAQMTLTSKLE